eukprot:116432_1
MGCCFSHKEVSSTNVDLDDVDEFLIDPESLKNEPFDSLSSKKGWWTWGKPLTILLCCLLVLCIVIKFLSSSTVGVLQNSSQNPHNGWSEMTESLSPPAPPLPANQNSSQNLLNGSSEVSSPAPAPPPPTNSKPNKATEAGCLEAYQKCEEDMNVRGKYFMSGPTKLYGVFVPAQTGGNESVPTIIYFYGYGGGTVRGSAYVVWQLWARLHRKVNVFVWDYRGFGLTGGTFPTESTMLDDSKAAFDYVLEQKEVDHEKVFAFGQAFGGAVAIQFVEKYWNLLAGAIFQNTFTEFSEKVSRTMPPELKSTEWKSIDRIGNIECPILMFSSQADKIVPPAMMLQLRKAAKKAKIVTIPKRGHKRAPLCSSKHGCTGNVKSCKRGFMCYWVQLREFINNPSAE